ncbi:hypothetical protein [Atopobacter phocae]|uniref:hypothetical protein n=1 Tax=Atopobacter phocae TaxID=136492 RepID=UPI00046F8B6D|nr:hypothetical protein [Atopobacter phocae]
MNQNKESEFSSSMNRSSWIGLDPSKFLIYEPYINRSYFCGSYSSAALIDYLMTWMYNKHLDFNQLLNGFKYTNDRSFLYKGTIVWDIVKGLRNVLGEDSPYRVRWTLHPRPVIQKVLNQKELPLIIGTIGLLSHYGNHWLLAYAYQAEDEQKYQVLCYDNHGKSRAIVNGDEILLAIWLEKIETPKEREFIHDKTV